MKGEIPKLSAAFFLLFLSLLLNLRLYGMLKCTAQRLQEARKALSKENELRLEIKRLEEILKKSPILEFPETETQKYKALLAFFDKLSELDLKFSVKPNLGSKLEKSYRLSFSMPSASWDSLKELLSFFCSITYPVVRLDSVSVKFQKKGTKIEVKTTIFTGQS